jgi:cyclopropane fatty-acyl-phospholipid synthase-like methyltransferase
MERPDAPATGRNSDAILEVLQFEFKDRKSVLEIGSGTGQHAVHFARAMPWLVWQTSDLSENHGGIRAWTDWAALANLRMPVVFDVVNSPPLDKQFDAVFSANTAHIMSFAEVGMMFEHVAQMLVPDGVFCLYGPFNENGQFTSASNAAFDASLRAQKKSMGIRDRQALNRLAQELGMRDVRRYALPANNQMLIWQLATAGPANSAGRS